MKPGLDFIQVKKFVGFLNYYSGFKHHKQRQIKRMCAKFSFPLLAYNPLKLAPDKSKGTGDKEVAISQIPRTCLQESARHRKPRSQTVQFWSYRLCWLVICNTSKKSNFTSSIWFPKGPILIEDSWWMLDSPPFIKDVSLNQLFWVGNLKIYDQSAGDTEEPML